METNLYMYDCKIRGYFYMLTIYDCKNKTEVKEEVKRLYGKCKIDYIGNKRKQ